MIVSFFLYLHDYYSYLRLPLYYPPPSICCSSWCKICHHFSALLYLIRLSSSIYASITCIHLFFLTFLYLLYSLDIFSSYIRPGNIISPLSHTHTHNLSYLPHIIFSVFTHYLTPSASAMPSQCECDTAPASQCQCDATPVPPCECDANTT